jgi:hypothetical protein
MDEVLKHLYSPDVEGQTREAVLEQRKAQRELEIETVKTQRQMVIAKDEETRVAALVARIAAEKSVLRDMKKHLVRTLQRADEEVVRAVKAETELASVKVTPVIMAWSACPLACLFQSFLFVFGH